MTAKPTYEALEKRVRELERAESECKVAQNAFRESEKRYRLLLNVARDMLFMHTFSPEGRPGPFSEVNDMACQLLGYSKPELLNLTPLDIISEDDLKNVPEEARQLNSQKQLLFEKTLISKSGDHIPVEINTRIFDWDGQAFAISIARDIRKRRQAEKALRESEERYRALFEGAANPIMIYNRSAEFVMINKAGAANLRKTPEEIIGKAVGVFFPDLHDLSVERIAKVLELGKAIPFEDTVLLDGKEATFFSIFQPLPGQIHGADAVQHISYEITEHKRAEEALRKSEERSDLAMNFANDGLFDWNLETNEIYYSPVWKNLLGYQDDEIQNEFSEWERLTNPEDVEASWAMMNELLEGKRDRFEKEFRMRHKNGHWVDILSRANVTCNEAGKPVRVVGTHIDITERKQAEKAIFRQKQKAERYLKLAGVMFIGLDADGYVSLANHKACEILECDEHEIVGKNWFDHFIPEKIRNQVRSVFGRLIRGDVEPSKHFENPVIAKSGAEKIIAWHSTFIRDDDGRITGILGSGEDITVRRQLEAQILQTQKMEAIGTLAGGIAHDFNNMMSIITGNISYALCQLNQHEELFEVLSEVQDGAKQAQALTQQLLTFAKGGAPVKTVADINHLIAKAATFIMRGATSEYVFDFSKKLWPAEVDEGQFNQIISNLVINATQAMPDGGRITIRTENADIGPDTHLPLPPGKYIRIIVEDQGMGIPEAHLAKIFDPFFTTKQKGSGLGLATTFSIIRKHGGHISAESGLGEGTRFVICLPVSEKRIADAKTRKKCGHQGHGRILIMDDQDSVLKMLGRMLKRMGYETAFARHGDEALEIYSEAYQSGRPFDLVVLDLTIPGGMGGLETFSELLKTDPDVKAVVSSGYSNDPAMADYADYGFCGVASKPYTKDQIAEMLTGIFGENQQIEKVRSSAFRRL